MSNQPRFEFFYDCSSPWTYLAFTRVVPLMEQLGVAIQWRPILVGGVFNAVNQELYEKRANWANNKRQFTYYMKDLADWADFCGIRIIQPRVFPVNSARAMRGAIFATEQGQLVPWSRAVFEAYWGDDQDISQPEVLKKVAAGVGLDPDALSAATEDPTYKQALRANTDDLIERGGYGSPTMFINDDDMYFGNDRLPLVEARLQQLLAG
jgi:2-hydroxychromene-2-carboxylate isomerase